MLKIKDIIIGTVEEGKFYIKKYLTKILFLHIKITFFYPKIMIYKVAKKCRLINE